MPLETVERVALRHGQHKYFLFKFSEIYRAEEYIFCCHITGRPIDWSDFMNPAGPIWFARSKEEVEQLLPADPSSYLLVFYSHNLIP